MGLGDIAEDKKEEAQKEVTEDIADELGIEDKDDLEKMDGRLGRILSIVVSLDKKVESLEEKLEMVKNTQDEILQEVKDDDSADWTTS